jgi:hypothetical protein
VVAAAYFPPFHLVEQDLDRRRPIRPSHSVRSIY